MSQLPGHKILVMGNHDNFEPHEYCGHFTYVDAYYQKYGLIFSHIPLHPDSARRWKGNVHGHLHSKQVVRYSETCGSPETDKHYLCVSLEQKAPDIGRPFNIDEIKEYFNL